MNPESHNDSCPQLREWLNIATDGLCQQAKERIAFELTAHFNEALLAHEADGVAHERAELLALRELGDAKSASERFIKTHLTEEELNFIETEEAALQKRDSKLRRFCELLLLSLVLIFLFKKFSLSPKEAGVFLGFFIFNGLTRQGHRLLLKTLQKDRATGWVSFTIPFSTILSMTVAFILLCSTLSGPWALCGVFGALLPGTIKWLSIFNKLRSEHGFRVPSR